MHLQTVNSSWDYYPRPGKSMKDISLVKVQKAMDTILFRNSNFVMETPREFLEKNELLFEEDKISNGCYLMFCKDDNLYSTIQMGHFASEIVIKDDQSDSGDIIGQIEEVMSFVRKHINKELIISAKQIENIQRWQYPLEGIREIVLNMIIHRDYTSSSDSQIKVFSDRILFFNPGSLPDSITIEQLLANTYVSTPRNRQIAKMVKEMGMIERYGTGIKRVRSMFTDYGLLEPRFETIPGGFAVTVFANTDNDINSIKNIVNESVNDVTNNVTKNVTKNVTDKVTNVTDDVTDKVTNVTDNVTDNVADYVADVTDVRAKLILKLIMGDEKISMTSLARNLGVTKMTITRDIQILKSKGLIKRIGLPKSGHWEVITK